MSAKQLSHSIKSWAQEVGFDFCGIAPVQVLDFHAHKLRFWLRKGFHADMKYMENNVEKRAHPALLSENAKSVVVCLLNYHQPEIDIAQNSYKIASYALGEDYHLVVKEKLKQLLEKISREVPEVKARVFTDTAPVLERAWAQLSGLGWIGKNSCLIVPRHGSWFFIGEILLDVELNYDAPLEKDFCGNCTRCIDACPTGALLPGRCLDAKRCISYLTIEKKDMSDADWQGKLKGNVFGCDICQNVCPWNRFAAPSKCFTPNPDLLQLTKENFENMDKASFNKLFPRKSSPVRRVSYARFMENVGLNKSESF